MQDLIFYDIKYSYYPDCIKWKNENRPRSKKNLVKACLIAELRDAIFLFQAQNHETFANRLTAIYILRSYQMFFLMYHKSQNVANKQ